MYQKQKLEIMKKVIFYFCLMLSIGVIGLLMWEASPAIAEKWGVSVKLTDAMSYMMSLPYLIAGCLFTNALDEDKEKNS